MKFLILLAEISTLISLSWPAQAIVNIESLRLQKINPGYSGSVKVSADKKDGNTNTSKLKLSAQLRNSRASAEDFAISSFELGTSSGETDTDKGMLHVRRAWLLRPSYASEVYTQLEHNKFTRLDLRALLGGGARYLLQDKEHWYAAIGLGAFFSRERLSATDTLSETVEDIGRFSSYLTLSWSPDKAVRVVSVTYYQPKWDEISDYRLLEQLEVNFSFNKGFSFVPYYTLGYDSSPPTGVRSSDHSYGTALKFSF